MSEYDMAIIDIAGRESMEFPMPDWLADSLQDSGADHGAELFDFCNETIGDWSQLLRSYCRHDRGSISDDSVSVVGVECEEDGSWSVVCHFEEFEPAGCSSLDVHDDREESLDLQIDIANRRIRLVGAMSADERSTDEEY